MVHKYLHKDLDRIMQILGTTQAHLWLFTAGPGDATSLVPCMGTAQVQYDTADEAAVRNVNAEWGPVQLPCGLFAYHFQVAGNQHIRASADAAAHTFGTGTVDNPFSAGAWVMPASRTAALAIIGKYDAGVGVAREWRWTLDTSGLSVVELYDESADTTEIGTSVRNAPLGRWTNVTFTYDGNEVDPVVRHYFDGQADATTTTVETGAYIAMEDTATPLTIGCTGLTTLPVQRFHGYLALVWLTGKELTATEVHEIYEITKRMILGD